MRPLPQKRDYGSVVFKNFETGVAFMKDLALNDCYPASCRLVDNTQFKFGQVLHSFLFPLPIHTSFFSTI